MIIVISLQGGNLSEVVVERELSDRKKLGLVKSLQA